eukprot:4222666-Pleurochrysis_carterae.AAC.1
MARRAPRPPPAVAHTRPARRPSSHHVPSAPTSVRRACTVRVPGICARAYGCASAIAVGLLRPCVRLRAQSPRAP